MVMDFDKKRKREFSLDKFLLKVGGVLLLVIVLALVVADFRIYKKRQTLLKQIDAYNKQIEEIKQRNVSLKEQITQSDNKDYIEKVGREELNLQKEGEKVVSFIMPEQKPQNQNQKESFWSTSMWFGWIGQSWTWIKSKF